MNHPEPPIFSWFVLGSLTHQSGETLEGSWDTDVRINLDENVLGGVDVDLQQTSLVQGTVQKGEQALLTRWYHR